MRMGTGRTRNALAVVVLAATAACGGGSGSGDGADERVEPAAWAADVCGAAADWVDEITGLNEDLQANLDPSSVQTLKDQMVGYFDDILSSTDGMLDDIEAAGVPDVQGGQRAVDRVLAGMRDARAILQRARDDAAALQTDDPQAFGEDLQAIGQEVGTSLGEVGDAMQRFESPELDQLSQDVPECQQLASVGG
jgi:hypothetical protein